MSWSEEQVRAGVASQAWEWFVANQAGILERPDRAAFIAWLKASPLHIEEYLGVALISRDLRAAVADSPHSLESVVEMARADLAAGVEILGRPSAEREPPARRVRSSGSWLYAAAAAAVAVLVTYVGWWTQGGRSFDRTATYVTAHGEQSVRQLPDRSVMHLNTDSAITVRYSRSERVVAVEKGQAFFEVAHDDTRRFRVLAGEAEVVAIGTRFDVHRAGDSIVVTVVDGRVAVITPARPEPMGSGIRPPATQSVEAGYQLRVDGGVISDQPEPVDLQQAMAWLQRKIVFTRRPLGEVADEFNRYATVPFEIDDPTLRALPVSGVFNAHDTESFAGFLDGLDGIVVERTATRIRVYRLRSETPEPISTAR
jgi:transmembrane sensor